MKRTRHAAVNEEVRVVDRAFADSLRRLDPQTQESVLQAAALASYAVCCGHAALDLRQPELLVATRCPEATQWETALRGSRWVGMPEPDATSDPSSPLVLEHGLLYLRRYREYEHRLALSLRRIAAHAPVRGDESDLSTLAPLFATLFPDTGPEDAQALAAALALLRSLLLVTGGPGTGKTTTIARILLLLIAQAHRVGAAPPRIALAAPTGRAAERMADSLRHALLQVSLQSIDPALLAALPDSARTLHRLLGTIPGSHQFRHGIDAPLPFDVIVVDEASMIDLPLMCKLTEAVADGARLILLGDRDQLPSIEAGDVLAAITDAAGDETRVPDDVARALEPLLGAMPVAAQTEGIRQPVLAGHRVHLRRGFRQSDALELAPLADAVRSGDAETAVALLRGSPAGVHFHEDLGDPLSTAGTREPLLAAWRGIAATADPREALQRAARVRLLTALREGPQGASTLNARIEEALAGAAHERYFHGRLVLVQENDYRQQLFNGDIGVCLRDADGNVAVWFATSDGARALHPSTLPLHGSAFAMTVHKAQGSEFDAVWLVLPGQDARSLSRELLYTAITRARSELHVCASADVLRATLARHVTRVSGLRQRLMHPIGTTECVRE